MSFSCAAVAAATQTTEEDCAKMPGFAASMLALTDLLSWEVRDVTTTDGYELQMAHITGGSDGTRNADDKGPILLWCGARSDSRAWFSMSDPEESSLIQKLFDEGYDVYLGNRRGTPYSRGHTSHDADGTGIHG